LNCVSGQLNELGPVLAQFLTVTSVTSEVDQSSANSIAAQALETANIAIATAQQAINSIPQTRNSGPPQLIPDGDSAMPISWSPAMPDANYAVIGTYSGTSAYPATFFAYHVEDGTRTVNGCTIRLNNTPANFKFSWFVQALPTA
jgi:hypothetical protein